MEYLPRVKVLNYLKKVALFFRFERDITCACPAIATRASRIVMMVFLFMFVSFLFYLLKSCKFFVVEPIGRPITLLLSTLYKIISLLVSSWMTYYRGLHIV